MNEETIGLFDLIMWKIKDYKGYCVFTLLKDADPGVKIFLFPKKEEFDKNFVMKGNYPYPKNITSQYGNSLEFTIDGDDFYVEDCMYLAVDGKVQR